MKNSPTLKRALIGTALTVPFAFALPAAAQDEQSCAELNVLIEEENVEVDIDEQEIRRIIEAQVEEDCRATLTEVSESAGMTAEEVDALSERVRASATEQERVVVEQEVVVEGEVFVEQQPPEVDVEQQGAEVAIAPTPPEVTVTEQQAEIVIIQKEPTIRVSMPQPTIEIEQPAPEIIITMPEPGVDVTSTPPQVEVRQAEPVVTVRQTPPIFDLELRPAMNPEETQGIQVKDKATGEAIAQAEGGELQMQDVSDPKVTINQGEATLNISKSSEEARVNIQRAAPTVRFEQAEPKVEFTQQGEPEVRFTQAGEPTVTIEQAESGQTGEMAAEAEQTTEEEAAEAEQTTEETAEAEQTTEETAEAEQTTEETAEETAEAEQTTEETAEAEQTTEETAEAEEQVEVDVDVAEVDPENEQLSQEVEEAAQETEETTGEMAAEGEQTTEEAVVETEQAVEEEQVAMGGTTADTGALMVGDLTGQDVLNEAGEDLGDLESVIRLDGNTWAIISAGGFLGIGDKDIPVELSRLSFGPEGEIIVQGLTEEQIDAAQEVDLQGAEELPADTPLRDAM